MIIRQIPAEKIIEEVKKAIKDANAEILATMDMSAEIQSPLPESYFELLKRKLKEGIEIKRLGFGSRNDYDTIRNKIQISEKKYIFKFRVELSEYQRLLIIDGKKMFFGVNGMFFESKYEPFIEAFTKYFRDQFRRGII